MYISFVKFIFITGCLITAFLCFGCLNSENPIDNGQIIGSGKIVSESRTVGTFTGIQVKNFAKVFITQDTVESLRIESDDNVIGLVLTSVNGSTLIIGLSDGSYNHVTVNVYVSMKTVRLLESAGAAEFTSLNSMKLDSLFCRITGTAKITLAGSVNYENVEIFGSGDIHTLNLVSYFCTIKIYGAGNADVNATQQLDAEITGAGIITYAGNPPVVHRVITGTGAIRPAP